MNPLRANTKVVTFEDLEFLDRCEHLFHLNRHQPKIATPPPEQKAAQVSGNAFHRAASAHPSIRTQIIEQELATIPVESRERVRVEVSEMVREADKSAVNEDAGLRREVQLLWTDPETGWTFASKPDLFGNSDKIRIKEDKRARRFYESHRFQVWFAAFVAAQMDLESQAHLPPEERKLKAIEMTVRCSRFIEAEGGRSKRRMWEESFSFPVAKLEQETRYMQNRIRKIMRRERMNYFRPELEFKACSGCPRRAECKPLLRNPPLMALLRAEEVRLGRPSVFEPVSTPATVALPTGENSSATA